MSLSIKINDIVGMNTEDNPYLVDYIDDDKITLVNQNETLTRAIKDGKIDDDSIKSLCILSRTNAGYAEAHGFVREQWVFLKMPLYSFEGNAKITNTYNDSDMIQLFLAGLYVYIDFAYKGLPDYVESITIINSPEVVVDDYFEIRFGDQEEIQQFSLSEDKHRYNILDQTNDMQDKITKSISDVTEQIRNDVHTMIQRYTELRELYSLFDATKIIEGAKYFGKNFSPMVDYVMENNYVGWLIPTIRVNRNVYTDLSIQNENVTIVPTDMRNDLINEMSTKKKPKKTLQMEWVNPFHTVLPSAKIINHRKEIFVSDASSSQIVEIGGPEVSYEDLIRSSASSNTMIGFAYTYGLNHKKIKYSEKYPNMHVIIHDRDISDKINVVHYNVLPQWTIDYYNIDFPGTNMVVKSNLDKESSAYWRAFNRFRFQEDIQREYSHDNYSAYIRDIVPSTTSILKKSKSDKSLVSFTRILELLQPYRIERQHISKKMFQRIRKMLEKNIQYFTCELDARRFVFNGLSKKYHAKKTDAPQSIILQMQTIPEFKKVMEYFVNTPADTSSEIMNNIIRGDGANVFMTELSLNTVYNRYPITYADLPTITTNDDCEKYNNDENKHYKSKDELNSDAEDGDCAIVDLPLPKTYFRREKVKGKSKWVQRELSDMKPADPACNTETSCITAFTQCDSTTNTKFKLKQTIIDKMSNEFENTRRELEGERMTMLEKKLSYFISRLPILKQTRTDKQMKNNKYYNDIASRLKDINVVESPYAKLRDEILGDEDSPTKQRSILRFVAEFTRPPNKDENQHWLLCKETSVLLLPLFFLSLARVHENGDVFRATLEEICRTNGKLSDDGDYIVDQYSGYILRNVGFSTDEGYDVSGRKMKSREIVQKEETSKINKDTIQSSRLKNLMNLTGIALDDEDRTHILACINNLTSEEELFFMVGYLILYVKIKHLPTKSFLGCDNIKSFDNDDTVIYMACVMKKTFVELKTIKNKTATSIVDQLKQVMENILSEDSLISTIQPPSSVEKHDTYKLDWNTFLPPLQKINIKFEPLPKSAKTNELKLSGNITMASMTIIQGVQKVLDGGFSALLKTASNVPFTNNTCCHEKPGSVYKFFKTNNVDIDIMNKIVRDLSQRIDHLRLYSRPYYLFDKTPTFKSMSSVSETFSEKIMYRGFIAFCKNSKECDFKVDESQPLEAQIEDLKNKEVVVNSGTFNDLLKKVNHKSMIHSDPKYCEIKAIDGIDDVTLEAIDKKIRALIEKIKILNNPKINQFLDAIIRDFLDTFVFELSLSEIYSLVDFAKNVTSIFPTMINNDIQDRNNQLIPPYLPDKQKASLKQTIMNYYRSLYDLSKNMVAIEDDTFLKDILLSNPKTGYYLFMVVLERFDDLIKRKGNYVSDNVISSFIEIFNKDWEIARYTEETIMSHVRTFERDERRKITNRFEKMSPEQRSLDNLLRSLKLGPWQQDSQGNSKAVEGAVEGVVQGAVEANDLEYDSGDELNGGPDEGDYAQNEDGEYVI